MMFHVSPLPPTETNINDHVPSLYLKKKKKSAQIPQSSTAVPTRSWDLWVQSERDPGIGGLSSRAKGIPHLWPLFSRVDYCDWPDPAKGKWRIWLVDGQFLFWITCVFVFSVCYQLLLLLSFSPFLRSDSLTQLCTHKHQGFWKSSPCVFFPLWAQDSWHFCSYPLKLLITSGGL